MKHFKAILYGIIIWAIVFSVAIAIFTLRENERPLFESIMPVVLTIVTVFFTVLYFKSVDQKFIGIGWCLGLIWLVVNIAIDLLMFMWGPMKMSFIDYLKDIGLTYLIILAIPTGAGYLLAQKSKPKAE